jgi:Xaa-Pro aminopeptidase
VIAAPEPVGAEKPLNAFETLTLAPIDRRLIEPGMLTDKERCWLDSYHQRVHEIIGPLVDRPVRRWLENATQPIAPAPRKQKRRRPAAKKRKRSRKEKR